MAPWNTQTIKVWFKRFLGAFWNSTSYLWDDPILPWDANSSDDWKNKTIKNYQSKNGDNWKNRTIKNWFTKNS